MTVEPVTPTVSDIYWTVCDADAKVDAWLGDTQLETDPRSRLMLATSQALINARHNLAVSGTGRTVS